MKKSNPIKSLPKQQKKVDILSLRLPLVELNNTLKFKTLIFKQQT